jgi:hypothetical protein
VPNAPGNDIKKVRFPYLTDIGGRHAKDSLQDHFFSTLSLKRVVFAGAGQSEALSRGPTNEVHDDGEVWSACLWKVRKLLGRKKADTVILESHFYLSQYADFKDGAEAVIMAEKNLYHETERKD